MIEFNRVIDGILRYMNNNLYSGMNDWQEVLARVAVGRMVNNRENLKTSLMNNGIVKTFAVMDSEGNVDIESLARDFKKEIQNKGKLSIEIPLFGKICFSPEDVDELYREITGMNMIP